LYVALDNYDAVAVIDTASHQVLANLETIAPKNDFPNPQKLHGASPNNLAISSDDRTLFVTNSGTNSVAVLSVDDQPLGHTGIFALIPTAWYPTAVSLSADESTLYVVNGKSLPGPNPGACVDSVNGYTAACESRNEYVYQIMQASLATIPPPIRISNASRGRSPTTITSGRCTMGTVITVPQTLWRISTPKSITSFMS
jgi:DNA-binding beta-propeller fold protein YncE